MAGQITAWSFSRYKDYSQCPLRAKFKHVDKLKEPPAPAMERGSAIHKLAEDFAAGRLKKMPDELKLFADQFKELKKSKPFVEEQWAFDENWKDLGPQGWFAYNAWCRVKTDAACVDGEAYYIIDHKTGKVREDHVDQLSLYATAGIIRASVFAPQVKTIVTQLWYLDSGDLTEREFSVTQLTKLKKEWEVKTKAMLSDTQFLPSPGQHCRWCPFSKSKGGKCKF